MLLRFVACDAPLDAPTDYGLALFGLPGILFSLMYASKQTKGIGVVAMLLRRPCYCALLRAHSN